MVYACHIFFNFQTNISKCHMTLTRDISISLEIFVSGICLDYLHSILPRDLAALGALWLLRTRVAKAFFAPPLATAMRRSSAAVRDGPPDEVCPAQTPTAIDSARRRCFPSCPTCRLHPPVHVGTCCACADGAGVGWSE